MLRKCSKSPDNSTLNPYKQSSNKYCRIQCHFFFHFPPFPAQLIIIASAYNPLDRKKANTALMQVASRVEVVVRRNALAANKGKNTCMYVYKWTKIFLCVCALSQVPFQQANFHYIKSKTSNVAAHTTTPMRCLL